MNDKNSDIPQNKTSTTDKKGKVENETNENDKNHDIADNTTSTTDKEAQVKNKRKKKREKKKHNTQNSDLPMNSPKVQLEHLPEAYEYLEYISVEYPSQTVCTNNQNILFAQCNREKTSLISARFKNINKNAQFTYDRISIDFEINRIRRNDQVIVAISDDKALIYNQELELEVEIHKYFSFGLDCNTQTAFFATKNGKIVIYDLLNDTKETIKPHKSGIDSLKVQDQLLYSASNDKSLVITDLRTKLPVKILKNDCDVNAVDVKGTFFAYGDDSGIIHHCDLRNDKIHEKIEWHKSPINSICFSTESIFASVSDEQIALFDTSLIAEEGWSAHPWLWFVHKGQEYYKETCVLDDKWVTTSANGISIFKPVQDIIESMSSDL